jgi:hypothetical protein
MFDDIITFFKIWSFCLFSYVHTLDSYFVCILFDFKDVFCLFAFFKQLYVMCTTNFESYRNGSALKRDQNRRSKLLSFSMSAPFHPHSSTIHPCPSWNYFFFFWVFGVGRDFFGFFLFSKYSPCVPIKFSRGSHQVPKWFPKTFSIASHFVPYPLSQRLCNVSQKWSI